MKNFPHKCTTMQKKNSSTLHRCVEFTKWPTEEACHQATPFRASTSPEAMTYSNAARLATPNT